MTDVLFITVDSLRADHVGHLGYERDTTPNMDALAEEGTTFENAFAHACSTRASFPSILSSVYSLMFGGYERVSEEQSLVSEAFSDAGYRTAGFHSNLYLSADFGYDRGFDTFFDSKTSPSATARIRQFVKDSLDQDGYLYKALARAFEVAEREAGVNIGSAYVDAEEITDRALDWVEDKSGSASSSFLWVHYMDVHHPYVPPEEHQRVFRDDPIGEAEAIKLRRKMIESPGEVTDAELAKIIDLYDAEIRYTDRQMGRLIERMRELWDRDAHVCVTADHGEEFLDHGRFSHYTTFYDEVMNVPLVVSEGTGRNDEIVGLTDVPPTLLQMAGVDVPETYCGSDLSAVIDGEEERTHVLGTKDDGNGGRVFAYRDHEWKYITRPGRTELYDLTADPEETTDVSDAHPEVLEKAESVLDGLRGNIEDTNVDLDEVEMDENVKQRLRDLGYQE
jgi:arylsulfatase A-like enzyme